MKLRKKANTDRKVRLNKQHRAQGRKLFVGGLAWRTSDTGLLDAFKQYGAVSAKVNRVKGDPKKSRGFGFVVFVDSADSEKGMELALSVMDGAEIDGKVVGVKRAEREKFHNQRGAEPLPKAAPTPQPSAPQPSVTDDA